MILLAMIRLLDKTSLLHASCALLHAIYAVFPPPSISHHHGGSPVLLKKLLDGNGIWAFRKELLGWIANGTARTIELPEPKIIRISTEIQTALQQDKVN